MVLDLPRGRDCQQVARRAKTKPGRASEGGCEYLVPPRWGRGLLVEDLTFPPLALQINELSNVPVPVMLMPDDFKAYSKIKVDNHLFNK